MHPEYSKNTYTVLCHWDVHHPEKNLGKEIIKALTQIVPHPFGDHLPCDPSWCGYLNNSDTYRHKYLHHGRDLSGEALKADLLSVFGQFINNVEKIAHGATTKDVESFNNVVFLRHLSVFIIHHQAVCKSCKLCCCSKKNIGSGYVNKINENIVISPGSIYLKIVERKDKIRKGDILTKIPKH